MTFCSLIWMVLQSRQALKTLGFFVQCPWRSEAPVGAEGFNFSMHSLKTTLLAWAIQVEGISEDMRLVQGHHRADKLENLQHRRRVPPAETPACLD